MGEKMIKCDDCGEHGWFRQMIEIRKGVYICETCKANYETLEVLLKYPHIRKFIENRLKQFQKKEMAEE